MKFPKRLLVVCAPPSKAVGVLLGLSCIPLSNAFAAEYYVATTGNDSNPGSLAQPFATLQKAANIAVAGDTVWIRGGTYSIVTPATSAAGITITKSGTSNTNRIKFWAYQGEVPVFDFSNMVISTSGYTSGFAVSGSWLHIKGLEIRNVPMNTHSNTGIGINDPAHDDILELLNIHHNNGAGLFISHGTGGHLILNCDSHDNYDPTSTQGDGQNADGFGAHYQETGAVTTFRGCRAWWNSDDGWDLISQEVPVLIENCWAWGNGYIKSGTARPADGNGNGIKAGSSKTGIRHTVRQNVAWGNAAAGFYANHSSGGNDWINNTSYNNGTQYNLLASTWDSAGNRTDGVTLAGTRAHKMRNNIGFPNKNSYVSGYGVDTAFNTWDLSITPAASDFASTDATGAMGPRQPDGSLPNLNFMKLRAGSQMIDKGTNVGLAYAGSAPDLGAYEFGATASGGAPATGGASSTGGTTSASSTGGSSTTGGAVSTTGGTRASGGITSVATTGGSASTGGTHSTGGTDVSNTGGRAPTGGNNTAGGLPSTGGAPNLGGNVTTSTSASDTGGSAHASGGANSATGGLAAAAVVSTVAGATSTASTDFTGTSPVESGSCSCRTLGSRSSGSRHAPSAIILGFVVTALARRMRGDRRRF